MRRVFGRLVRRYLDVTGAPLRAMGQQRADDRADDEIQLPRGSLSDRLIDLRDARARRDQRDVIDLDDAGESSQLP